MNKKRNALTLDDKISLIKSSENKSGRQLAEEFKIGKSQVSDILKRKREFLDAF